MPSLTRVFFVVTREVYWWSLQRQFVNNSSISTVPVRMLCCFHLLKDSSV